MFFKLKLIIFNTIVLSKKKAFEGNLKAFEGNLKAFEGNLKGIWRNFVAKSVINMVFLGKVAFYFLCFPSVFPSFLVNCTIDQRACNLYQIRKGGRSMLSLIYPSQVKKEVIIAFLEQRKFEVLTKTNIKQKYQLIIQK